jgi:TetR/AcrR family transcriptional regulator
MSRLLSPGADADLSVAARPLRAAAARAMRTGEGHRAAMRMFALILIIQFINISHMDARAVARSIGRPRQGTGRGARDSLLDAAVVLFAEHGVAGTTIAEIAARAGVTAAMVHYYFSDRDRLLDAVVEERLLRIVTAIWSPVVDSAEVVPILRGLVRRILKAVEARPWLPSLWLREVLSEGGQLRPRMLKRLPLDYIQHLIGAVANAQRRGLINPELEPRLVFLSVIGLTLLPLATIRVWKEIPVLQQVSREDVARHAEALLVSAFSPRRRARVK